MKHTAKKCILLLAGLALAAVLSGCTFFDSSVEQLFTLPRMAEEYTGLSQQIDSLIDQGCAKAGEVWTLGLKGTDASVTWAMDGDSNGVCKLEGAKVTVTGTSSGRYATIVGTVGGGTVKAIIRIR